MAINPKIEFLAHDQFFREWEDFSVTDGHLSGEEWNNRREELIGMLSGDFLFTGRESGPADFFVGEDWFQTRVQCLIFFSWHFLCSRMLATCQRFVETNRSWGVSIVTDDLEMDFEGPEIEMMITRDYVKIAARGHTPAEIKRFLIERTDLTAWI